MDAEVVLIAGQRSKVENTIGLNHCGLICDRGASPLYITWNGSVGGLGASEKRSDASSGGLFMKMPAHKMIGFPDIQNPRTGRIEPNPDSWMGSHALNEHTDFINTSTQRISIPVRATFGAATNSDQLLFGIDANAITTWWIEILNLDPNDPRRQYRKFAKMSSETTNCCGMVGRALQIGRLDAYASPPSNLFYQGSASLIRWVNAANVRIKFLNKSRSELLSSKAYRETAHFPWGDQQEDFGGWSEMPSVEDWLRHSAVKESLRTGFARRKDQILEIDKLLPKYHSARANYKRLKGAAASPLDSDLDQAHVEWEKLLLAIYEQCFRHLADKPFSDRRVAVMSLTKNVEGILCGQARYQEELVNGTLGQQSLESHGTVPRFRR